MTNSCCVLWDEVTDTFANISYLQDSAAQRVFFEVDKEYNLIVPLRVMCSSIPYVVVVRAEEVDGQARTRRWPLAFQKGAINPRTCLYDLSEHEFLKAVATRNHYDRLLRAKLEVISDMDCSLEQGIAKTVARIVLLDQMVQELYEHHRLNTCQAIMENINHCLEYPSSHLFLVLPSSLERWDDMDPTTHSFRLYFICDPRSSTATILPQHIHVTGHQGYDIDQPQAFFQQYGQYTLTLLNMVKHGYPRGPYSVPASDTFEILRPGAPVRHVLTRENIGPLVDKSIAHISKLSFKKSLWKIVLNPRESRHLGSFLRIHGGELGLGGLHRVVERMPSDHVHWRCPNHAEHTRNSRLESIVGTLGGKVDRSLHTIAVSPSAVQVVDIATALQGTKSVFDATIRFTWIVSRDELQEVLALMAHSGVVALQLDGLTSKARIHNSENEEDMFVDTVGSSKLQLVTLLNYPQPSEQYLYLGKAGSDAFGLQLSLPAELPHFDWFNLRMTLERGLARIGKKTRTSLIQPSLQEGFRQLVLEKDLNIRGIDLFEPESKMWQGRLGMQRGVVIGLSDTTAPSKMICRSLLEYGTLRALRLRTQDSVDIPYLHSLIELNPRLQYLDIPAQEERIFKYLGPLWRKGVSGQLQVVLRELSAENTLHRIASLVVGTSLSDSSGSVVSVGLHVVVVSRWQSQYVSGLRADQDARVLDIATLKFPSVVTSLILNLSAFTRPGHSSIQKVLQRSSLERLVVHCSHFDSNLREYFGQVLSNVQWPTIKSPILVGVKIDDWIRVWTELGNIFGASPGLGPRLSCFDIVENIQLQDDGDWDLIIGAFDFATLKSLSFLNSPLFNTATLMDQLKEQLSDLELIVLTSSLEEKCLTFISLPAKSVVQTQYRELDIKGINMSQTNDIWHTLTASGGFQYGLARAMIPNDPSSPRV
ncbi:hypothetical protein BG006_007355, partial [Podila minutissima]